MTQSLKNSTRSDSQKQILLSDTRLLTLSGVASAWHSLSRSDQNQLRSTFVLDGWRNLCRDAVIANDEHEIDRWLNSEGPREEIFASVAQSDPRKEVGDFRLRQMRAHLLCAKAACSELAALPDEYLNRASGETGYSPAFYRDLLAIMYGHELPVSTGRAQRLSVVLVGLDGKGVVSHLLLERIFPGTGSIYPSPSHSFLYCDDAFHKSQQIARIVSREKGGKWRDESDVRWTLEHLPDGLRRLSGGSLGGAFATGIHFLFADPCDLRHIALTATVASNGELGPIRDLEAKIRGANYSRRNVRMVLTAMSPEVPWQFRSSSAQVRPVQNVSDAVSVVRSRRRGERWRRYRWVFVGPILTVLVVFGSALILEHCVHSYVFKGGERVFVTLGIPNTSLPHRDLDTGFIMHDFRASAAASLVERGLVWKYDPETMWAGEIASSLPQSPEKVNLNIELGNQKEALTGINALLGSGNPWDVADGAADLLRVQPDATSTVERILLPLFDKESRNHDGSATKLGRILMSLEPSKGPWIADQLCPMIVMTGNQDVNLDALAVIARTDSRNKPFAVAFLSKLLQSPDDRLKLRAAAVLYTLAPERKQQLTKLVVSFLLDGDSGKNDEAFHDISSFGFLDPDAVQKALESRQATDHGGLWPIEYDSAVPAVSRNSARSTVRYILADTPQSLKRAARSIGDVYLTDDRTVDAYTQFAGMKIAYVYRHHHGSVPVADCILADMQSNTADYWAIYRNGCALALANSTPPSERKETLVRLQRLWSQEHRAHIKIALGIAIQQLETI